MKIERQIDETYFEYLKRLTSMINDGVIGYEEYGDSLLGNENTYSSDNLRKAYYVIRKLIPLIENDIHYSPDEETLYKQIEMRERELYKASVRLRDQRRELRKWDTSEARFEHLVEIIKELLQDEEPLEILPYGRYCDDSSDVAAILMLSDWHYGALVDTQFNFYNTDVAQQRAFNIFNKCVYYSLKHKVSKLHIEINGDMIHGLINVSNRVQSEEDVVEQIVHVSKLLSHHINKLKPYYKEITVVTTMGNHGRLLPEKKQSITKENFEKLIAEFLKLRLDKEIKIISIHSEDFITYDCDGKTIFVAHGQYDKPQSVWENCIHLIGKVPDEIHLGHTHNYQDFKNCNTIITVNGSLMGADDYAMSLRKNTKPSQNLIIYEKDRCIYELQTD